MTSLGVHSSQASPSELRAVKRYFARFPRAVVAVWILGLALIVAGVSLSSNEEVTGSDVDPALFAGAVVAGFAALIVGTLRVAIWLRRPSGNQMDSWLNRDLGLLQHRAIDKCGLTGVPLTADSLLLTGPRFSVHGADFAFRVKRSGMTRFTPVGVTILNFTEHEIFSYQCAHDRFTGNALGETTDEYFYTDVVSVSTRTENLVLDKHDLTRSSRKLLSRQIRGDRLQIQSAEVFTLTTSGGTSIKVVVGVILDRINQLIMGPGGAVDVDVAGKAIAGMRQMLREKKIAGARDRTEDSGEDW